MESKNIPDDISLEAVNVALHIGSRLRSTISEHSDGELKNREYQILEIVVGEYLAGRQMLMEQGMGLKHLGSRFTNRKSIQKLIDNGFARIEQCDDARQHPLVPTVKALNLFSAIRDRIHNLVVQSPTIS